VSHGKWAHGKTLLGLQEADELGASFGVEGRFIQGNIGGLDLGVAAVYGAVSPGGAGLGVDGDGLCRSQDAAKRDGGAGEHK